MTSNIRRKTPALSGDPPTSDSRELSPANLLLSTKTATARVASAVSRPTVVLLVNPRTMKPASDATAHTSAYGICVVV